MKKILILSSLLVIAVIAVFTGNLHDLHVHANTLAIGGTAIATSMMIPVGNNEVLERLSNGFDNYDDDNYDDEFDGKGREDEQGVFTFTVTNTHTTQSKEFYLFSGLLIGESNLTPLIISGLGWGVSTTVPQSPQGQMVDGAFYAINDTLSAAPSLTGAGDSFTIARFLSYCISAKRVQTITGLTITSPAASGNHSKNIAISRRNPYKELGNMLKNISLFRSPRDVDRDITIVRLATNLTRETEFKMSIAPSSTITVTLFMNGQEMTA